ncbi:AMP-binding protein [Nocardia carnea]|uniref:AMP-binding protein n=1 Tax=Nocardia carnea TaxID=37328 RepID=UPI002455A098|nr:AMP-binding protein [Nocardia carnea]
MTVPPGWSLTAAQRGIADALHLWPQRRGFALAEYLTVRGPVDPHLWAAAVRCMITDTEAQRIRLVHTDSGPRQVIDPADRVPVTVVDLAAEPAPEDAARARMEADLRQPCDPYAGVTTAHLVLITGPGILLWYHRAHHVALDGYGFAQCARRVAEHYRALRGGPPVPPPDRGLVEVIAEDLAYTESARCAADGAYWRSVLPHRSAPTPSAGPLRSAPEPIRTRRALSQWRPPAGARYGAGESILAAVAIHLGRHLAEGEIVLGVPMMNRLGSVAATVPTMVLNAVAVPVRIEPAETVTELAVKIGQSLRAARRHSRYRHERLRAELGLIGAGRSLLGPIVNIMPFDYELGLPGIATTARNLSAGPVEDLSINVYLRGGDAELIVDANPGRYNPAQLDAHADAVVRMIGAVAAEAGQQVADLGIDYVPLQFPANAHPDPPLELFVRHVRSAPDAPALIDGDQVTTRGELLTAALARARVLTAHGVKPGDLVAVVPGGEPDDIVTVLSIAIAGAAHAALDLTLPVDRLRELVTALEPAVLVHDGRFAALVADMAPGISAVVLPPESVPAQQFTAVALPPGAGYAVLTSGSTGRPKAVRVGGGALAVFVGAAIRRYRWGPQDRVVQFGPLHADTSVEEIFVTLAAGGALVATRAADRSSPAALLALAGRTGATVLDLPTAIWHELAVAVGAGTLTVPPSVRLVVIGGEEASPELVSRWHARGGPPLHNSYGPSEAAIACVSAELVPGSVPPVPLGALFPGTGAALAVDRLAAGPDSRCGLLHLYGPALAEGYLPPGGGFREITVAGTVVRAFGTGDRVRVLDNGTLEFVERVDGTVKVGGQRVGVRAIEDLLRREPGVRDAMITRYGEFALHALVTVTATRPPDWCAAVRRRLAERLPPAWVPARVRVVEQLPRTRNLKADRSASAADDQAPGATAAQVLAIFAEILGRDDLTADDDFFAAGGTSMQTIAVANRLTVALGAPVEVDDVLARPTAAALAAPMGDDRHNGPVLAAELASLRADLAAESAALRVELAGACSEPWAEQAGVRAAGWAVGAGERATFRGNRTGARASHRAGFAGDRHGSPVDSSGAQGLRRKSPTAAAPASTGPVLLTGATGFLGAYLLAELLNTTQDDVVVPVRAAGCEHARQRLRAACTAVVDPDTFDTAWESGRVRVVTLPLAEFAASPAASAPPSRIVHSAAEISAVRAYSALRSANVESTAALVRLAYRTGAALTVVSTATAAGPRGGLGEPSTLPTGYAQSKSVAEHLLATAAEEFGVAATIARPGRILPHPADSRGARGDFLHELVAAAESVGAVPRTTLREPMVRADDVARLVIASPPPGRSPRILDLSGPEPVAIAEVLGAVTTAESVPLDRWRELVAASGVLPVPRRSAVLRWCDIQLAGFDRDWASDYAAVLPARSVAEVVELLGLRRE